jgi:hypothetical protein
MINKIQNKLKAIFTSKFAKFMGHVFLINLTLHFWAEMNDPYGGVEEYVKVANMLWIISVFVFYIDRLILSNYKTKIEPLEAKKLRYFLTDSFTIYDTPSI